VTLFFILINRLGLFNSHCSAGDQSRAAVGSGKLGGTALARHVSPSRRRLVASPATMLAPTSLRGWSASASSAGWKLNVECAGLSMLGEYGAGWRSTGLERGSQGPPRRETTRSCSEVRQRREGAVERREDGGREGAVERRDDGGRDDEVGRGGTGGAREEVAEERAKREWRRERGGAGTVVVVAVVLGRELAVVPGVGGCEKRAWAFSGSSSLCRVLVVEMGLLARAVSTVRVIDFAVLDLRSVMFLSWDEGRESCISTSSAVEEAE
jgi:hypothetical protein